MNSLMYDAGKQVRETATGSPKFKIITVLLLLMIMVQRGNCQEPVVKVRFSNPEYSCVSKSYCVDVEFQSNTPGLKLFTMNVRFLYVNSILKFQSLGEFQGEYMATQVPDPVVGSPSSGSWFGFPGSFAYFNGVVELVNKDPLKFVPISSTAWTKLFNVCFHVDDPSAITEFGFCPAIVWDLEMDPSAGGFFIGDNGIVMTVVDPTGVRDSAPVSEEAVQFNWAYDGTPAQPFGAPVPVQCVAADLIPPVITTEAVSADLGINPPEIAAPVFSATDNCDPLVTPTVTTIGPEATGDRFTQTWTATSKDATGNEAVPVNITYTWIQGIQTSVAIDLISGWNIISSNLVPAVPDIKAIFQDLINEGSLIKVQDETGKSLEDFGVFGGWTNNIGDLLLTEGYKVKVNRNCVLHIEGTPAVLPFDIPLNSGWNLTGYPRSSETDALAVVQQLIDRNTLIKVQDEMGRSIEDFGIFGGWNNNIGNFLPGQGYKVDVNANEILSIYDSYPKSLTVPYASSSPLHFHPVPDGNGVDHMNINLVNINGGWFHPGDEIGVFDGTKCIGAVTLLPRHMESQVVSIPVSASDEMGGEGFTEGNPIIFGIWKTSTRTEYAAEIELINGTATFVKHESMLGSLNVKNTTGLIEKPLSGISDINIYPNPTDGKVYIQFNNETYAGSGIRVINAIGQVVWNRNAVSNPEIIDLSGGVSGIYYIQVSGNNRTRTEKVLLR